VERNADDQADLINTCIFVKDVRLQVSSADLICIPRQAVIVIKNAKQGGKLT
jgi:hypothetical protein